MNVRDATLSDTLSGMPLCLILRDKLSLPERLNHPSVQVGQDASFAVRGLPVMLMMTCLAEPGDPELHRVRVTF